MRGFSIVATMIAVTIFVFALAGSLRLTSASFNASKELANEHAASDVAQGLLELMTNTNLSLISNCGGTGDLNDPCLGVSPDRKPLAQCCFSIGGGLVPTEVCGSATVSGDTNCTTCKTGFCSPDFAGYYYRIRTDSNPANNAFLITITIFYPDPSLSLDQNLNGLPDSTFRSFTVTEAVSR